jgi:hypothetical protein
MAQWQLTVEHEERFGIVKERLAGWLALKQYKASDGVLWTKILYSFIAALPMLILVASGYYK